jgi:hypothetical protein
MRGHPTTRTRTTRAAPTHTGPLKGQSAQPAHNQTGPPTTPSDHHPNLPNVTELVAHGREAEQDTATTENAPIKEGVDWGSFGVGAALGALLLEKHPTQQK